ncbi:MAG: class I SAM-dependent methyltransferase [Planctomycetota bacterium]
MNDRERVQLKLDLFEGMGLSLSKSDKILDFGCGDGRKVNEFRDRGYDCQGCDVRIRDCDPAADLAARDLIREIERPYRVPFDDSSFSLVFSDQVFEHVRNPDATFREIHRILKPGGFSLHIFPTRYVPIEPHVHVPFAAWFREPWWLAMWARMGVRSPWQKGLNAKQTTLSNYRYLNLRTNYLTRSEIVGLSDKYFASTRFCMRDALRHHPRTRGAIGILACTSIVAILLDRFSTHVVLQSKSEDSMQEDDARSASTRSSHGPFHDAEPLAGGTS